MIPLSPVVAQFSTGLARHPAKLFYAFISIACLLLTRAYGGIGVELQVDNNGNAGSQYYLLFATLSTNSLTPMPSNTLYYVWSPTGSTNSGVHSEIDATGNSSDGNGGNVYNSYESLISEITNQWTLMVVQATFTNFYHFAFAGFPSNDLPAFSVLYPLNNQADVSRSPDFVWQQGPTNYAELFVQVNTPDYNTYFNSFLPLTQTNWQTPGTLTVDTNYYISVTYNDFPTNIVASTPVDGSANFFPGWTNSVEFSTYNSSEFTPTNGAPATGHVLIADYTFDNTNYVGEDFSPRHDSIDCGSYWGVLGHQSTSDAVSGGAALEFFGDSSLTPCGRTFTNLENVLVGSFSVSLWINTTNSSGGDSDSLYPGSGQIVMEMDQNTTIPVGITGSKLAFATSDGQGGLETLHSIAAVNTGHYVYVVVTRDEATGIKQIYINGLLDSSEYGVSGILGSNVTWEAIGSDFSSPYVGLVDQVQVYRGILSASDVANLYANPGSKVPDLPFNNASILLAHYAFEDPANLGADSSGNGFNLDYTDGNEYYTNHSVVGGGSVYFNGNGYLSYFNTPANLLQAFATSYSVSLWINTTQNFGSNGAGAESGAGILAATLGYGQNDAIPVSLAGGQADTETGVLNTDVASTSDINDGNWHHIVVTRDQTSGEMQLFVDGSLNNSGVGTTALLNSPLLITIGALADAANPDPSNAGAYNGFNGYLDDIQIYATVLSTNDVNYLYRNPGATIGGGSSVSTLVAHYPFDAASPSSFDSQFLADTSGNGYNISGPSTFDGTYPQPTTNNSPGNNGVL